MFTSAEMAAARTSGLSSAISRWIDGSHRSTTSGYPPERLQHTRADRREAWKSSNGVIRLRFSSDSRIRSRRARGVRLGRELLHQRFDRREIADTESALRAVGRAARGSGEMLRYSPLARKALKYHNTIRTRLTS